MIDQRRKGKEVTGIVVLFLGAVFLATNLTSTPRQSMGDYQSNVDYFIGQKAPDFRLMNVNGNTTHLSDFSGKLVIINFWATWCVPCREEIPGFVWLHDSHPDDLVILGISMDQNRDMLPAFLDEFGMNYPILYGNQEVFRSYGDITGIPTTFILDRNLIIQRVYIGYRSFSVFRQAIEALI